MPLEVVFVLRDAHPLDGERVGAEVRHDRVASRAAFTPVISATTVMIDDTATMLPSSVSIDRSLLAQIDASASIDGFEDLRHRSLAG